MHSNSGPRRRRHCEDGECYWVPRTARRNAPVCADNAGSPARWSISAPFSGALLAPSRIDPGLWPSHARPGCGRRARAGLRSAVRPPFWDHALIHALATLAPVTLWLTPACHARLAGRPLSALLASVERRPPGVGVRTFCTAPSAHCAPHARLRQGAGDRRKLLVGFMGFSTPPSGILARRVGQITFRSQRSPDLPPSCWAVGCTPA